jgi:hypothetical protein
MPHPRRLLPFLLMTAIAVAPASAIAQGGAGDDQYQDPFGGTSTGSSSNGSSSGGSSDDAARDDRSGSGSGSGSGDAGTVDPTTTPQTTAPSLTPEPQTDLGDQQGAGTAGTRQELPRTGLDAPVVALLGVGLLAAGIGLRLRTVDGHAL